jgi:hypothetical protein
MWRNITKNSYAIIVESDPPKLISKISVMKKNGGSHTQEYIAVMVNAVKDDNGLCEKLIQAFNINRLYCSEGKFGRKYVYFKPQSNDDFHRFIGELITLDDTLTKDIELLLTEDAANYHYEETKAEIRIERPFFSSSPLVKEKRNKKSVQSYNEQIQRAMSKLDEYQDTLTYSYDYIVSDIAKTLLLCGKSNPEYLVDFMHEVLVKSFSMMKDVYGKIKKITDSAVLVALFDASYQEACKKHAEPNPVNTKGACHLK